MIVHLQDVLLCSCNTTHSRLRGESDILLNGASSNSTPLNVMTLFNSNLMYPNTIRRRQTEPSSDLIRNLRIPSNTHVHSSLTDESRWQTQMHAGWGVVSARDRLHHHFNLTKNIHSGLTSNRWTIAGPQCVCLSTEGALFSFIWSTHQGQDLFRQKTLMCFSDRPPNTGFWWSCRCWRTLLGSV